MEPQSSQKLSNKVKLGYALGAIPQGLLIYIFELKYIELFFQDLRLLPILFIIGQVIYLVVNAFNDPLLGQLSDRTNRERWGSRRIIYIKYGGPIWALSFLIVWFPWSFDNQIIIFIHYVVSICLFDTFFTLVAMVWLALLPEMTADTQERSKVNFLTLVIGAIAVIPFFLIVGEMSPLSVEFRTLSVIIAVFSTVMLLIVSKTCKERPEFQNDKSFPLWTSVKNTLKLKSFRYYIGYIFFSALIASISLGFLFAYTMVLGENGFIVFFLIFVFGNYTSMMICLRFQPKWGIRKTILRFGALRVAGTFVIFLSSIVLNLDWLIIVGYLWLMVFSGYTVFEFPLLHLSIDEDELNNGSRRDAMFFGMQALFNKPAVSLGPIIAMLLLLSFGFIQGSETQPASALLGIKVLLLVYPAVITVFVLIFVYFHPLHGKTLETMQKNLEELHAKKREQITKLH